MVVKFIIVIGLVAVLTSWSRAEWKTQSSGTMAWLYAVYFVDDRRGWIAGSRGTLLVSSDGGVTWAASERFTNDTIRDVYFSDPLHGWLLCERSPYDGNGSSAAYLLMTRDGGKTWQDQELFEGGNRAIRLVFRDAQNGCVIGEGGYLSCTSDGGNTWKKHELPVRYLMLDGRFLDHDTLVLAGGGGTVLRSGRGQTDWLRSTTPADASSKINSVYFVDQKLGWAVGVDGRILFTANAGQTWRSQTSTVKNELRDVWFGDSAVGYAVGDGGVIIRTENGGINWNEEARPSQHRLEALAGAGSRLFAVGFGGTILAAERRVPIEGP